MRAQNKQLVGRAARRERSRRAFYFWPPWMADMPEMQEHFPAEPWMADIAEMQEHFPAGAWMAPMQNEG
ncbi:MAG TPA: hypothetical protein VFE67_12655 [Rudaea sp.]|jgi:hypothetical protein|nr:hypothetical protein [Rudaea sp.]